MEITLSFVCDTVLNLVFIPQWFKCLKKEKKENAKIKSEIDQSYEPAHEKEAMLIKAKRLCRLPNLLVTLA